MSRVPTFWSLHRPAAPHRGAAAQWHPDAGEAGSHPAGADRRRGNVCPPMLGTCRCGRETHSGEHAVPPARNNSFSAETRYGSPVAGRIALAIPGRRRERRRAPVSERAPGRRQDEDIRTAPPGRGPSPYPGSNLCVREPGPSLAVLWHRGRAASGPAEGAPAKAFPLVTVHRRARRGRRKPQEIGIVVTTSSPFARAHVPGEPQAALKQWIVSQFLSRFVAIPCRYMSRYFIQRLLQHV